MKIAPLLACATLAPLTTGCSVDLTPLTPLIERAATAYDQQTAAVTDAGAETEAPTTDDLVADVAGRPAEGGMRFGPEQGGDRARPAFAPGGMPPGGARPQPRDRQAAMPPAGEDGRDTRIENRERR